ncbi:alpha/beta hydrolase [Bacillus mycoides]|uniref:alpha/beta hydrolase n=1 Tax=Bacillus mycoides TaxID=1405 RepID=UPI001C035A67|nr:alpha/beta hydrolase [Bacillus mycoides]QWG33033.1 alpha/beta hydrolase [Bacillus mycoides]QWG44471.1 alpha/beta hydrolase [Bacillus mycoides]QWH11547.1 alpha/beta hydrolase [Bacillus mycoides]
MKVLVSTGSSIFLQLLFLYIFILGVLLEVNPWYAVVVYISVAILSLFFGIYSIVRSVRKGSNAIFLTISVGVVTSLFAILIIGFTVFAYFLPEAGIPPVISL